MNYLFKKKKVKIDFNDKENELLVLSEDGSGIEDIYVMAKLKSVSAAGIRFSAWQYRSTDCYRFFDLFFHYIEEVPK